jgi:aerobic carbon-monoxide dehydrogenase small subunit
MYTMIAFELNGKPVRLETDAERTLLWVLRTDFSLTGTKCGCAEGHCRACTVLIDDRAVRSCLTSLKAVAGKKVVTIEGLGHDGRLHPLQQAFVDHDALQCGFCTPGMLMTAAALLHETPKPSREAIVERMDGNLCRCGAHLRIVAAVEELAQGRKAPP